MIPQPKMCVFWGRGGGEAGQVDDRSLQCH